MAHFFKKKLSLLVKVFDQESFEDTDRCRLQSNLNKRY